MCLRIKKEYLPKYLFRFFDSDLLGLSNESILKAACSCAAKTQLETDVQPVRVVKQMISHYL